jgi:magnesium transporter
VIWHDLRRPDSPELDELAERYRLHPLHVEDCRHGGQRAKVEEGADYLFVVLKPVHVKQETGELDISDLDIFVGRDFVITVEEGECPAVRAWLDQLHASTSNNNIRPDQLFYKVADGVVDAYVPVLDWFNEGIDKIEDHVLENPSPEMLQRIFETKRGLIELRRALANMRDVAGHLQRLENPLVQRDLLPFLRDLYDHLARNMDSVEMQRDLLTGAMDVYLSSVANRTNQVMKVLTVLGTIALPSIVISGFFGMNLQSLPWANWPHGAWVASLMMVLATAGLLVLLKKLDWY